MTIETLPSSAFQSSTSQGFLALQSALGTRRSFSLWDLNDETKLLLGWKQSKVVWAHLQQWLHQVSVADCMLLLW